MGLNQPSSKLGEPSRRLRNVSISTEHVSLSVPSGAELVVTEDVATQLQAASTAFVDSDSDRARQALAGITEAAAAEADRLAALDAPVELTGPPPVKKAAVKPAKKAATKP